MCKKLIYLLSLVFVLSMVLTGPADAADPNLLLWLEFEDNADDSSDYGRLTAVTGSLIYGAGVIGQGADLGGNANYVTIAGYPGVLGASAFSISAWCLPDSGNNGDFAAWGSTAGGATRFEFRSNSNRLRAESAGFVQGDTTWNQDGEWHHVAVTVKAGATISYPDVKLYLDGFDDTRSSTDPDALNMASGFDVKIGQRHSAVERDLNAWFDDVRIYDYELSAEEVRILSGFVEPYLDSPADEAVLAATGTFLKWTPGVYAADVNGHEVYLGDNYDDVNTGTGTLLSKTNGDVNELLVSSLNVDTVYYWKVDAVNDSHPDVRWSSEIWSFMVPPYEAWNESPADGEKNVPTDANLSWSIGLGADSHQVYFGTNFNDVNTDSGATPQSEPNYDPGTMAYDTNYYWRVDEFDGSDTHKGNVWTFKTLPDVAVTDVNLVCWWTFDEGEGTTAVDWSGHNNHGTLNGDPQFVAGYDGGIALDFDADGDCVVREFSEQTYAAFTVAFWAKAAIVGQIQYTGAFSSYYPNTAGFQIDVDGGNPGNYRAHPGSGSRLYGPVTTDWVHLAVVGVGTNITLYYNGSEIRTATLDGVEFNQFAVGLNRNREADKFFDGMIDDVRIYDKALTDAEIRAIIGVDLAKAWKPRPANGATDVPIKPILMWEPGDYAPATFGHKVYFGADDPGNMVLVSTPAQPQTPNEYDPGALDLGRTYYWKIDEVNGGGVDAGNTWSFTVIESFVVDSFDNYPSGEMWKVWMDGAGDCPGPNNTNSGAILYEESVTTYGGSAGSMKYDYDNDGTVKTHPCGGGPLTRPKYSRAVAKIADLPSGIDPNWLAGSPRALALRFYGYSLNDPNEEMWLELTDDSGTTARVTYGPPHLGEDDINDVNETSWHQWNIDLQEFVESNGVSLAEVNAIAIGFGNPGETPTAGWGYGTMYIDDIRLYAARCLLEKRDPDFARVDYVEDCVVDYKEVEEMVEYWLAAVPYMAPIPIDNPGFEDPVLADGEDDYSMDNQGWGFFDVSNDGYLGSWNPGLPGTTYPGYGGNAPEGQNVGWTNPGGVGVPGGFAQVLTDADATLTVDTTYTLTVEVGNTLGYPWGGYKVQLLAGGTPHTPGTGGDYTGLVTGGTLLAEDNNSLTIAEDTFETSTVTYTYNPALHSGLLGEPLQIRLLCLGNVTADDDTEADFDDVRLFQTSERADLYKDMDMKINFKDYALLADRWLDEELWP